MMKQNMTYRSGDYSQKIYPPDIDKYIADYDAYGNSHTSQTASHPVITYAYDTIGRMTGLTDQVGSTTSFIYDKRNLLQSKTDPLNKQATFYYDNAGRLSYKIDRKNIRIDYAYTPTDKINTITYPDASQVIFTYNNLDQLTAMQDAIGTASPYVYDAAGRLTSMTDSNGYTISYAYDAAGNLTELTYPGNKKVIYTYDKLNRLETVRVEWLNQTALYSNYDVAGRLRTFTNFNGTVTTYDYDNANRLTSISNQGVNGTIAGYNFVELDANGNRKRIEQTEPYAPAIGEGATVDYAYNAKSNRLTSAGSTTFTYDDEGQIATSSANTYTFDYEHRLKTIAGTNAAQFYYDGSGNRLKAVRSGTETRYIYDASGRLLAEADSSNNISRFYIYGNGLLAMVTPAGQTYCYHFNGVGSTIAMTNSSKNIVNQYSYDAFGNIPNPNQQETISQPFKYVGQYGVMTEPNGFYYMKARYYDPTLGRFISEDPIGFDGGDVNLMAYVGNNPVRYIDPWGLFAIDIIENGTRNGTTYGATINVTGDNGQSVSVSGSTWPNPNNPSPGIATGTYDAIYSETGHKGITNGVRLENGGQIPTLGPNPAQNNQDYATGVNIHSGYSSTNRGSAGCITIDPQQSSLVWNILQGGETGRVTIIRKP